MTSRTGPGTTVRFGVLAVALLAGLVPVTAEGAGLDADLRLAPAAGPPTSSVTVWGRGFGPSEAVAVAFDQTVVGQATTGAQGRFRKGITVPASATPGPHVVRARGMTSGLIARATFTVRTDWPTFRFSRDRVGVNPYENLLGPSTVSGLAPDWSTPLSGPVASNPAVVEGSVYIGSDRDETGMAAYNAVDAATGALRWSVPVPLGAFASPAVADGVVYAQDNIGEVYAFDAATGAIVWSRGTLNGGYSSPAVAGGAVYIGAERLYALDADTGATIWTGNVGSSTTTSSPAVQGGRVLIGSRDGRVYAFDARTGQRAWVSERFGYEIGFSSPAVADGRVFIGTDEFTSGHVVALDQQTGEVLWRVAVGGSVFSSPAVHEGIVYVGESPAFTSELGDLLALDAETGETLWSAPVAGCYSSPAVANGVVYIGSDEGQGFPYRGKLYAVDAATGTVLWSHEVDHWVCSSPSVSDGRVYVGSFNSNLYSFALGASP